MAALNVSALLDALSSSHGDKMVREAVSAWIGAAPAKVKKASKPKKEAASDSDGSASAAEDKPKRAGPDAWNAFINLVCGPKEAPTSGYAAWLEENPDKKGNKRFSYAKEMKGEDDCDYNAFKAEFKSSASSASSVSTESKPKKAAAKPKKAAAKPKASAAAGAGASLLSDSEEEAPKAKKLDRLSLSLLTNEQMAERTAKMRKDRTAAAKPKAKKAELPPLPLSDDEEDGISRIELYDQSFFWDADKGTLYEVNEDGSRGTIVGGYDGTSAHFS
jgi:hypothetical protein